MNFGIVYERNQRGRQQYRYAARTIQMITNEKKSKTRQFQCYNRTHSIALKRAECARQTVDRLGISCYAFASLPIQMINTFSRILSHSSKCYLPLLYIYYMVPRTYKRVDNKLCRSSKGISTLTHTQHANHCKYFHSTKSFKKCCVPKFSCTFFYCLSYNQSL